MRKILTLIMVASIFSLVACGPSEEEKAKAEADATAAVEEMFNGLEEEIDADVDEVAEIEGIEHVCNDQCTPEKCFLKCGEKGHVCTDACHKDNNEEEATSEEVTTE